MNPINPKLIWKYQKHEQILHALLFRRSPDFVFKSNPSPLEGEIPVFVFHDAFPEEFEKQCLHLVRNGYQTISADRFQYEMQSKNNIKKTVVLTFDDGLKHVWTVAYPILKKYGLQAICFLNPGCIRRSRDATIRPNLDNLWDGKASREAILSVDRGDSSLSNWKEIRVMHESGVIEFQSHTMYHDLVFTSPDVFDFCNPQYYCSPYGFSNIHIPVYRMNGQDVVSRNPLPGMPIYHSKPRMSAEKRFFADEEIRNLCVDFVEREGAEEFFKKKNWRKILRKLVRDRRRTGFVNERYESPMERDKSLLEDMLNSKSLIEEQLPGKKVTHLCYPWFEASPFAVQASKKAGYAVNYFGCLWGKATNRPGDDLYRTTRIGEEFLLRLPGIGRRSLRDTLHRKVFVSAAEQISVRQQEKIVV